LFGDVTQQLTFETQAQCAVLDAQGLLGARALQAGEHFAASPVLLAQLAKGLEPFASLDDQRLDVWKAFEQQFHTGLRPLSVSMVCDIAVFRIRHRYPPCWTRMIHVASGARK